MQLRRALSIATSIAAVTSSALFACGGASKPAAQAPVESTEPADSGAPEASVAEEPIDASPLAAVVPDAEAPPPTHPPVEIRGKCVDPIADAKSRAKLPKNIDLSQPPTRVDLDGDGVEDWIITTGADTEYSGYVYITRRNCGIYALNWKGTEPIPLKTWTRGFVDLQVSPPCRTNCCPVEQLLLYKWNGRTYAKAGSRTATRTCLAPGSP